MGAGLHLSMDDGQVAPDHRVTRELLLEMALRVDAAGEDHQPRGLLVQALDRPERRIGRGFPGRIDPADRHPGQSQEGIPVLALEGDGQDPRGLAHHRDVGVQVDDQIGRGRSAARGAPDLHALASGKPPRRIGDGLAVHPDPSAAAELACLAPGRVRGKLAHQGRDRQSRLLPRHLVPCLIHCSRLPRHGLDR